MTTTRARPSWSSEFWGVLFISLAYRFFVSRVAARGVLSLRGRDPFFYIFYCLYISSQLPPPLSRVERDHSASAIAPLARLKLDTFDTSGATIHDQAS